MILTILKILGIYCLSLFATDTVMQTISYSFYKGNRQLTEVSVIPQEIQINDSLSGYGYNLQAESDKVILCFGGSMYGAYNTVGMYAGFFDCPFLSVDYYGTQNSKGKMNLKTMQKSARNFMIMQKQNILIKTFI